MDVNPEPGTVLGVPLTLRNADMGVILAKSPPQLGHFVLFFHFKRTQ
jgi:hypothetical protein